MLPIDNAHYQLGQLISGLVVLNRQLAAKSRLHIRWRAFDRDEYVVVKVAAADSVHAHICEQGENKRKWLMRRPACQLRICAHRLARMFRALETDERQCRRVRRAGFSRVR